MKKSSKLFLVTGVGLFLTTAIVSAAVQLSVSQQKVKTLHASITYQDVIGAPQINGDPATRLLKIVNVPAEVEIMSAYMKTSAIFELNGGTVRASLDAYNEASEPFFGGVTTADLRTLGVIREVVSHNILFVNDGELYLSVVGDGDLSQLSGGNLEILVNYIEQ